MSAFEAPRCYAIHRLNPFRGLLQVVQTPQARALSADGVDWEIQVLAPAPEHDWRSANANPPQIRYFRFGGWNREQGLQRVPVSPILDLGVMLAAERDLVECLPQASTELPFALPDRHELWLLDRDQAPLALVASVTDSRLIPDTKPQPWSAAPLSDHGFVSASLQARGIAPREGGNPRRHAEELERLVRNAAGKPPRMAWFLRHADGSGETNEAEPAPLPASHFPALPLGERWSDQTDARLVGDYHDWCAPYLLTLPGLSATLRQRLERAAARRAGLTEALHHLFPEVIDPELLRTIRVEARLRASVQTR